MLDITETLARCNWSRYAHFRSSGGSSMSLLTSAVRSRAFCQAIRSSNDVTFCMLRTPHASLLVPHTFPVGRWEAGCPDAVELGPGCGELFLEGADLGGHAHHDFGAGEVDAEVIDPALDLPDAFDVAVGVHADVSTRALRFEQAGPFVVAERLLVHADEARGDGDNVDGLVVVGRTVVRHFASVSWHFRYLLNRSPSRRHVIRGSPRSAPSLPGKAFRAVGPGPSRRGRPVARRCQGRACPCRSGG